jgi:hypothetical protein
MVKPNFWQDLPTTTAFGLRRGATRQAGSRRARRSSCRPVRTSDSPAQIRPARRSLASRRRDQTICAENSQRLARNQAWLARWLRLLSAVPELTRGIDIKLNARLSLRGHRNPIASSHRTRSPFGSAIQSNFRLVPLSPRDCKWSQAVRILNKMRVRGRDRPG